MKTGQCYFRTENSDLWLAESFVDENGVVTCTETFISLSEYE